MAHNFACKVYALKFWEGSKTSLILKDTKTEASCRTIFMTAALREELKQWLERLKREEALDPKRYRSSGMLLRPSPSP